MESAKQVIEEVTKGVTQKSASRKDEITIMKAMINDSNYKVDVYEKEGKVDEYCPSADIRKVISNVMSTTTKMSMKEASELVNNYEFTKADATALVGVSKEFINTYLQTGRKLPLGGRATSNIELMWKNVAAHTVEIPSKNSSERTTTSIPAHGGIKVICPCPSWVK